MVLCPNNLIHERCADILLDTVTSFLLQIYNEVSHSDVNNKLINVSEKTWLGRGRTFRKKDYVMALIYNYVNIFQQQ